MIHNFKSIYLIFGVSLIFSLVSCKDDTKIGYQKLEGETMGTYYVVSYEANGTDITYEEVEEVLEQVNLAFSTYRDDSYISLFNQSKKGIGLPRQDTMTKQVFEVAKKYYELSDGYYDPTVMPLVNYWGFGNEDVDKTKSREHQSTIDSLLEYVILDSVDYVEANGYAYLRKNKKGMQLDFSSIAKGYGIDVLVDFINKKGLKNYLVDIGGEARASGLNPEGKVWRLAINTPDEDAEITDMELVVALDEKSIATSGNYRNVYELDGKKYSHTINPRTGYPERTSLLSASVIADKCMDADAIATTLMVLGMEKGKKFIDKLNDVEVCLIYDADGDEQLEKFYTEGFTKYLLD